MEERKSKENGCSHVLLITYPRQGHINPMLQLAKRLSIKGIRATIVTTIFISKTMHLQSTSLPDSVQFDTISDGYDQGGFAQVGSIPTYLSSMKSTGSKSLRELIQKYNSSNHPIDCLVYDPFLPWVLEVAKEFGLFVAVFLTQMCAVNCIYYYAYHGLLKLPISSVPISIPGLPLTLDLRDIPSFVQELGVYPAYYELVMNQFSNIHKADIILVNSFYKLEDQVVDAMSKLCPLVTIGPTVPSFELDKEVLTDRANNLNLFQLDPSAINWLKPKPAGSVIFVSFGSLVCFSKEQMREIALCLLGIGLNFLWVIPDLETKNLPKELLDEMSASGRGLVVNWTPQLEVLSSQAVGCFLTHCGWNSTIEALCFGVPMVAMPQWTDQPMNAKYVEDVWKVGIRVKVNEDGIVTREELEFCLREVMEKELGREMRINAMKWKELAIEAVSQGGTSDNNINEFLNKLKRS